MWNKNCNRRYCHPEQVTCWGEGVVEEVEYLIWPKPQPGTGRSLGKASTRAGTKNIYFGRPDNGNFNLQIYRPRQRHRGKRGDDEHDEYDEHKAAASADTDLDHNVIDANSLNNVLIRLSLFLSDKSELVMMSEEAGHIIPLSTKYHAEAAGNFYTFNLFSKILISI